MQLILILNYITHIEMWNSVETANKLVATTRRENKIATTRNDDKERSWYRRRIEGVM